MGWTFAYRGLMGAFLLTAALNLLHARAGFLTNYLADLTVPALLYVLGQKSRAGKTNPSASPDADSGAHSGNRGGSPVPGERRDRSQSSFLARRILRRAL